MARFRFNSPPAGRPMPQPVSIFTFGRLLGAVLLGVLCGCTSPSGRPDSGVFLSEIQPPISVRGQSPVIATEPTVPPTPTLTTTQVAGPAVSSGPCFGYSSAPCEYLPNSDDSHYLTVPPDSLGDDLKHFTCHALHDTIDVLNADNVLVAGLAAGGAVAIRQDVDDHVRNWVGKHPNRWGNASNRLGEVGDYTVQVPVLLGLYGVSRLTDDTDMDEVSGVLLRAYTVNAFYTTVIKVSADTQRPTTSVADGRRGFPSFHTSSNFTIAAVMDEFYGPKVGIPLYAFAGLIGWSRIDSQAHDLSDVFFGASLGYVIGKSVARKHLDGDPRAIRLLPYQHPIEGAGGIAVEARW